MFKPQTLPPTPYWISIFHFFNKIPFYSVIYKMTMCMWFFIHLRRIQEVKWIILLQATGSNSELWKAHKTGWKIPMAVYVLTSCADLIAFLQRRVFLHAVFSRSCVVSYVLLVVGTYFSFSDHARCVTVLIAFPKDWISCVFQSWRRLCF